MSFPIANDHPIRQYLAEIVDSALTEFEDRSDVRAYLTDLLVRFMHQDGVYSVRDSKGRRVESVADMLVEGDVRLKADSFDREREVHRHVGDFLLFWTGMFPERPIESMPSGLVDPCKQGSYSYFVASTFDYNPYDREAPTLRTLSEGFDECRRGLYIVRRSMPSLAA